MHNFGRSKQGRLFVVKFPPVALLVEFPELMSVSMQRLAQKNPRSIVFSHCVVRIGPKEQDDCDHMYSYLTFSLVLAVTGLVVILNTNGRRRSFVLWSALFAAPTGLADFWFAPDYWQPDHVIGPHFSVEGMMFSFGNGALLAFLVWPFFSRMLVASEASISLSANWSRVSPVILPGFLAFLLLWDGLMGPLPVMQASFVGFVVLTLWLAFRRQLNPVSGLAGAFLFSSVYWAQTLLWSWFDHDLASFWSAHSSYLAHPLPMTGLPGDELLWAAFYGLLWPHIITVALGGSASYRRVAGSAG